MDKEKKIVFENFAKLGKLLFNDTDISIPFQDEDSDAPVRRAYNTLLLLSIHTSLMTKDGKYIKANIYDTMLPTLMRCYIRDNEKYLRDLDVKKQLKDIYRKFIDEKEKMSKILEYFFSKKFRYWEYMGDLGYRKFSEMDLKVLVDFGYYIAYRI